MPELSTDFSPLQLLAGTLLGMVIAWLAWRIRSLSNSGAWAAALVGGIIFGVGGLPWALLLLAFFISSSALSKTFKRKKASVVEKFAKGSRRDWQQVAANGGLGALLALASGFFPDQSWIWLAYAGAMAAVNADTWATELGVLSPTPPRLITTGKVVERGTSGGVSLAGSLAALGGGLLIAILAACMAAWAAPHVKRWALAGAVLLGGLAGSFFDSFLGATLQGIYYCPSCQKETERSPRHSCGTTTTHLRGWRVVNNEVVNFSCSLVGGAVAAFIGLLF